MNYLGIDVGTGGTRALVIDSTGKRCRLCIGGASELCQPASGLG